MPPCHENDGYAEGGKSSAFDHFQGDAASVLALHLFNVWIRDRVSFGTGSGLGEKVVRCEYWSKVWGTE